MLVPVVSVVITLVLLVVAVLALWLHTRLDRAERAQLAAGVVSEENSADGSSAVQQAHDARPVLSYMVRVDSVASAQLNILASLKGVSDRPILTLPVACSGTSTRPSMAPVRCENAWWMVLPRGTGVQGHGPLLYDAVLQGRVRYVVVAGQVCRVMLPNEAVGSKAASAASVRTFAAALGASSRDTSAVTGAGQLTWPAALDKLKASVLVLCSLHKGLTPTGSSKCSVNLHTPTTGGGADALSALLAPKALPAPGTKAWAMLWGW